MFWLKGEKVIYISLRLNDSPSRPHYRVSLTSQWCQWKWESLASCMGVASTGAPMSGKGTPGPLQLLTTKGPPWLNSHSFLAPGGGVVCTLLSRCSQFPSTLRLAGYHMLCLLQEKQEREMNRQQPTVPQGSPVGAGSQSRAASHRKYTHWWSWGRGPMSNSKLKKSLSILQLLPDYKIKRRFPWWSRG